MNRVILVMILAISSLFGQLEQILVTENFLEKDIKIVDIRTPPEWKQTGIVKGSYTIMFFDEKGGYDMKHFLSELNKIVKDGEKFALICRTGSRTTVIAPFLSQKLGYNVVNLKGGIEKLIKEGYRPSPYRVSPLFQKP